MEACGKAVLGVVDEELEKTGGICLWQLHIIHVVDVLAYSPSAEMPTASQRTHSNMKRLSQEPSIHSATARRLGEPCCLFSSGHKLEQ